MKKTDKARTLIIKGLTLHLEGATLKKIYDVYNKSFEKNSFNQNDISFVNYLTTISIRNRGVIETIINKYIKKKLPNCAKKAKAAIILGIAQIFFSKVPSYAAVNSTVNLFVGKISGWRRLANAVLRKINQDKDKLQSLKKNMIYSVPSWIYKDWLKQFGKQKTLKMLKVYQHEPPLDIRVKEKINLWVQELEGVKIGSSTVRVFNKGKIENLKGYEKGHWWIQDFAAQLPVISMGNIKGKNILDLCASPGGKTLQMLNAGAIVTSIDISKERAKQLHANIKRVGLTKNFKMEVCDIMKFSPSIKPDIVLLDTPCTGTGTFRKNPDVLWIKNKKDVIYNADNQKKLLQKALNFINKDGILIYSNCSLQYEEGEDIIQELCKKKIILVDKITYKEISGYPEEIINKGLIRTLPYMYNGGMDGFFVARIKKPKN